MKLKKLLLFVLLISIVLICSFKGRIIKASEIDSEKVYCNATIEDEFKDNEVFITIKNTESLEFNEYTINDFSEINCIAIEDLTDEYKDKIIEQLNGTYTGNMPVNLETFNRILKLTLPINSKQNVLDSIKKLEEIDCIKSAEPNYIIEMEELGTPDDYYYNNLLNGVSSEWVYESMNMEEAWEYTDFMYGKTVVLVGVYDGGIYDQHPDLVDKISEFGIYIDNKGAIGYKENCWKDSTSHGTRIAGIIGAQRENGIGIAGVCNEVELVSLRDEYSKIENFIKCIEYAESKDVRIINCSRDFSDDDSFVVANNVALKSAIMNYPGLLVCGAGNSGKDNDTDNKPCYPASYDLPNIISVGGIMIDDNEEEKILDTIKSNTEHIVSNYGQITVDLFAPGYKIVSTYYNSVYNTVDYNYDSGTSYAAPFVTGVAALILSIAPDLSTSELKATILNNVTPMSSLTNKCVTGGKLNAEAAVKNIHRHSYTYTYDTTLYHHGECSCGVVVIEPHLWMNVFPSSKRCIGCGETIFVINSIKKEDEEVI